MDQKNSLFKLALVLLAFGTAIAAVAQRAGSSGTVVPICVKGNGQLRMLTGNNAVCGPSEQQMEWVVGGEVTEITAGRGLIGSREDGEVQLELDPDIIQGCGSCGGGNVFAGFNDGPGDIPLFTAPPQHGAPLPVIGSLPLPPGAYVIVAKLWLRNESNSAIGAICRLSAGDDFDWVELRVETNDRDLMVLTVVHEFSEADVQPEAVLGCADGALEVGTEWNDLKIIAIEAGSLSNIFLGDG